MSDTDLSKVWVLIPAAGVGKRMNSDIPKQYLKVHDKTVIEHTLNCFITHPEVAGVVVALGGDDPYWKTLKLDYKQKPLYTVEGGKERSDSVLQTLDYLLDVERVPEQIWVMVHDAARPCLLKEDIDALLALRGKDCIGGILATPVKDTMKRSIEGEASIEKTESRKNLWHALTPQLFRAIDLKKALDAGMEQGLEITDEASAIEALGEHPILVEGKSSNIKITQPEDLAYARWILSESSIKNDV